MRVVKQQAIALALSLAACGGGAGASPDWKTAPNLEAQGWLISTTANPRGDTWLTVGGTPERGMVLRETAPDVWTPEVIPDVPLLNWSIVLDDGSAFAVGTRGTVLHFDGAHWSLQTAPTSQDLWGIWGATADDVWAVGGNGQADTQATLLHYDGQSWRAAPFPALARPNVWAFYKVWGANANDVYVVGQRGAVLHFDGAAWSELGVGIGEDLIAVWGVGPDRIAVVGGRTSGVIATFDGARWNTAQLAPLPGLNGVWMSDRDHVYVAGIDGALADVDFTTLAVEPHYQATDRIFHALHGAAGRLLAVGGNLGATAAPYLGIARARALETP